MDRSVPAFAPKTVLCVAAHPDDLEFGCSGSVVAWTEAGVTVHYLVCTDGGKGSSNPDVTSAMLVAERQAEQRAAADVLGVASVTFLDHEDGMTEANASLRRDIAREIRRLKPDAVVVQDPAFLYNAEFGMINHLDHRNVGLATMDAVYPLARDRLSFPELAVAGFMPHNVTDILFITFDQPNFYVDVTGTMERKLQALAAHASQVNVAEVRPMLEAVAERMGERGGMKRAEGYIRLHMRL